jgi:hypothetical protein
MREASMTLGNAVRQWRKRRAEVRELDSLGWEQCEALARDLGVPPEMLPALVARGPDAAAELPRLMQALSLDTDEIRRIHAALMRDMSLTCSGCTAAVRCRGDLDAGRATALFGEYCPNADTLEDLQGEARAVRR